ncbi:MAG: hypothetical protein H6705_05130 [Myxococcales bacterium]|nr:hypothetical protein [Myxococcales bacterium]
MRPLRTAGYTQKLFEFLVMYPGQVHQLFDAQGALRPGVVTHEGLVAFVHVLHREVSRTPTPDLDRLLTTLDAQGHPDVVAYLRDCQARRPDQTRDTIERAFSDAMRRCEHGHLLAERARAGRVHAFEADRPCSGGRLLRNEYSAAQEAAERSSTSLTPREHSRCPCPRSSDGCAS